MEYHCCCTTNQTHLMRITKIQHAVYSTTICRSDMHLDMHTLRCVRLPEGHDSQLCSGRISTIYTKNFLNCILTC